MLLVSNFEGSGENEEVSSTFQSYGWTTLEIEVTKKATTGSSNYFPCIYEELTADFSLMM